MIFFFFNLNPQTCVIIYLNRSIEKYEKFQCQHLNYIMYELQAHIMWLRN